MEYAQIKDGVVQNIIILEDDSLIPHFSQGYDYFIRVDNLDPIPWNGDLYDGVNFSHPSDSGD